MEPNQLLQQAESRLGGVAQLAKKLGLSPKAVYQWRKRGVPAAWQRVIKSEILKKPRKQAEPA